MPYSLALMGKEYAGLAWKFYVSPDSCDNPDHYEQYLRLNAISDHKIGMGITHLLLDCNEEGKVVAIAGFVTLRATSLVSTDETGVKIVHPSVEISELAVSKEYERRGIGTGLINLAISVADDLRSNLIGIKYVVLCADPKSVGFYEKMDFGKIGDLYETLREGWNNNCEPMYITLPEPEIQ